MDIFGAKWPAALLLPFSLPYLVATWLRNLLYDVGVLRQKKLPCHVIAVGNLTVGGTGKTPMVEFICRAMQTRGARVCVLSRGYRRSRRGLVVVSDGHRLLAEPTECGDEPFMLASKLAGVPVIVDRDRVRAGHLAISRFSAQVLVLDDALQYRRLLPDASVVLVDSQRGFGNGWLLPAGPLRELPSRLRAATVVVLTRADDPARAAALAGRLRRYTQAPILTARHQPVELFTPKGQTLPLQSLRRKRVAAFCGIAHPDSFFAMLAHLGAELVYRKAYADHHRYDRRDAERMCRRAAESAAECLITTEKDFVRLRGLDFSLPLWCLRIAVESEDERTLLAAIAPHRRGEGSDICCEKIT